MARVGDLIMAKKTKKTSKTNGKLLSSGHDPNRVMQNGVARTLGMRIVSMTKKKIVAEMPIDERHMNRNGRVNGGALMAFADAMGAVGIARAFAYGGRINEPIWQPDLPPAETYRAGPTRSIVHHIEEKI